MEKTGIKGYLYKIINFFEDTIWDLNRKDRFWVDLLFDICRFFYLLIHGLTTKRIIIHATALAYTTLLSIVPFIAVSMALFKAFGGFSVIQSKIEPMILDNSAIGTGESVQKYILEFTQNLHAGALGIVGVIFLILTVIGLLLTIEGAFNDIWGVKKSRSLFQRFTSYWTMITIGPLLVAASIGLTASFETYPFSKFLVTIAPYVLTWVGFMLLYIYMPNTTVHYRSAFLGGVVAGTLWILTKEGYQLYAAKSVTYSAIYGSLSALPIFLIWLYLTWVIILVGAEISFANQNIETYREERRTQNLSYDFKEFLALNLVAYICEHYQTQKGAVTAKEVTQAFGLPIRVVNELLYELSESDILFETGEKERYYAPSKPLENIFIDDVIGALRAKGDDSPKFNMTKHVKYFRKLESEIDEAIKKASGHKNFAQVLSELPAGLKIVKS